MANNDLTFPTKTIAKLLDLTVARVGQLAKEGIITKLDSGRYPASAIPEYVKWLRSKAFGKDIKVGDSHQERARLLKAQADEKEMVVEEMRGNLILIEDVEEALVKNISDCRARLLVLPTKIASEVLHIDNLPGVQEVIKSHVYEALNELAKQG